MKTKKKLLLIKKKSNTRRLDGNFDYKLILPILKKDKTISDVYFKCEKLNKINYNFWKEFIEMEEYIFDNVNMKIDKNVLKEGVIAFRETLNIFETFHDTLNYDIYIVSASDCDEIEYNNIEMCVTVLAKKDCPITTHIGIFRTSKFFMDEDLNNNHHNLSLYLHSFCAKCMLEMYKQNPPVYMVTTPVKIMYEILKKNFPNDFWLGSAKNLKNYMTDTIIPLENFKKLLKNLETDVFTVADIYSNYENYEKVYNLSKLNFGKKIKTQNEFISELKNKIKNLESYAQYEDKNFYFPSNNDRPDTPLNDLFDQWIITDYNNEIIKFDKPEWFDQHKHLRILKKGIINLKAMAEKFIDM
jgi:hypothetical protein